MVVATIGECLGGDQAGKGSEVDPRRTTRGPAAHRLKRAEWTRTGERRAGHHRTLWRLRGYRGSKRYGLGGLDRQLRLLPDNRARAHAATCAPWRVSQLGTLRDALPIAVLRLARRMRTR